MTRNLINTNLNNSI